VSLVRIGGTSRGFQTLETLNSFPPRVRRDMWMYLRKDVNCFLYFVTSRKGGAWKVKYPPSMLTLCLVFVFTSSLLFLFNFLASLSFQFVLSSVVFCEAWVCFVNVWAWLFCFLPDSDIQVFCSVCKVHIRQHSFTVAWWIRLWSHKMWLCKNNHDTGLWTMLYGGTLYYQRIFIFSTYTTESSSLLRIQQTLGLQLFYVLFCFVALVTICIS